MTTSKLSYHVVRVGLITMTPFLLNGCSIIGQLAEMVFVSRGIMQNSDLLVSSVKDTKNAETNVASQFHSSTEEFMKINNIKGGEAAEEYKHLSDEYDKCQSASQDLDEKISKIQYWGNQMFVDWGKEIGQYSDRKLAADSQQMRANAYKRYGQLMTKMNRAKLSKDKVLRVFSDKVLFVKHVTNGEAVAGMETNLGVIQTDMDELTREMNESIAEADQFIATLPNSQHQ